MIWTYSGSVLTTCSCKPIHTAQVLVIPKGKYSVFLVPEMRKFEKRIFRNNGICHLDVTYYALPSCYNYLQVESCKRWTWPRSLAKPNFKLWTESLAGNMQMTTVFRGAFGWFVFATWNICLKVPPPLSPPILTHISSSGITPCDVNRFNLAKEQ